MIGAAFTFLLTSTKTLRETWPDNEPKPECLSQDCESAHSSGHTSFGALLPTAIGDTRRTLRRLRDRICPREGKEVELLLLNRYPQSPQICTFTAPIAAERLCRKINLGRPLIAGEHTATP